MSNRSMWVIPRGFVTLHLTSAGHWPALLNRRFHWGWEFCWLLTCKLDLCNQTEYSKKRLKSNLTWYLFYVWNVILRFDSDVCGASQNENVALWKSQTQINLWQQPQMNSSKAQWTHLTVSRACHMKISCEKWFLTWLWLRKLIQCRIIRRFKHFITSAHFTFCIHC